MEKQDVGGVDSWKPVSVAPDFFREVLSVPENEIPALVALVEQGPVDTWNDRMRQIGNEWCHANLRGVLSSANHPAYRREVMAEVLDRIAKKIAAEAVGPPTIDGSPRRMRSRVDPPALVQRRARGPILYPRAI